MIKVYTIFSLARNDGSLAEGTLYFYPPLNGAFGGFWETSAITPIIFVKKDY